LEFSKELLFLLAWMGMCIYSERVAGEERGMDWEKENEQSLWK